MTTKDTVAPVTAAKCAASPLLLEPVKSQRERADKRDFASVVDVQALAASKKWGVLRDRATDWLRSTAKDLSAIEWLTIASIQLDGFAGALDCLKLIEATLRRFWAEGLEPESPEDREVALRWLNHRLANELQSLPITQRSDNSPNFTLALLEEAKFTGLRTQVATLSEEAREALKRRLKEGKPSVEDWQEAVAATDTSFLASLAEVSQHLNANLSETTAFVRARLGRDAPDFEHSEAVTARLAELMNQLLVARRGMSVDAPVVDGEAENSTAPPETLAPDTAGPPSSGLTPADDWQTAIKETEANWPVGLSRLQELAASETSGRDLFFRRAALADVYLAKGRTRAARILLEDLVKQIDELKLHQWESGAAIAKIWVRACECRRQTGDAKGASDLYERLCKVAPWYACDVPGEDK